ncbi:TPA: pseudaminic acid cytidylyltransferase [Vibrio vulnificus]|uniref:pseudaminic acid cytidylyltransferase n=1 Tax=Vibrio vulnificus TaxID=672 RepID=UPI0032EE81CF
MENKLLVIIPARGGSKRIPKKNIKKFLGKEIIRYPIEAASNSKLVSHVIVSTDCEEIKNIALESGALVPFMRSGKNSDDFATTFDVIKEVVDRIGNEYDYICCIYPTSIFVTSEMIDEAIDMLLSNSEATSIASVLEYTHPIQRALSIKGSYLSSNHPEFYNCRSQDLEKNYHDAGQFYIFNVARVMEEKRLITTNCLPFIIDGNLAQDIDNLCDWNLAEIKYGRLVRK